MEDTKNNSGKLTEKWNIALDEKLKRKVAESGIRPEDVRSFIKDFGSSNPGQSFVPSGDWRMLRDLVIKHPGLQLVGQINAGKTYSVSQLIKNDKDRIYIVLDSHNEFDLPVINQLSSTLTESCKLALPKQPAGAVAMFNMYKDLIRSERFPSDYVLVIEESLRYENSGLKVILAECRKFIKVLAIMQEKLYGFCPSVEIIPHNPF